MSNNFEDRFGRLLNAVLDGRVVPFVGAGFSHNAKLNGNKEFSPNVSVLIEKLSDLISENYSLSKPGTDIAAESVLAVFKAAKDPHSSSLGQLAEIAQWLTGGHQEVLQRLEIELFAKLLPRRAHRYLAYLVREGLVNEVITTNYDACLEEAYFRSFGKPHKERSDYVGVVHNVRTYRKYGARIYTEDRKRYPVLRVYKINGCATEYSSNEYRKEHELPHDDADARILLTERELQDFGREMWARDLLRDRARSQALMFVGFGSEEPQVRHTVLVLMEEFHQEAEEKRRTIGGGIEKILELKNAPFLIVHKATLSFPQLQIMAGFIEAHRTQEYPGRLLDHYFGNVLSGCDCTSLDIKVCEDKPELDADKFMERLFQAVFGKLLVRYSSHGSSFYRWFDPTLTVPGYKGSVFVDKTRTYAHPTKGPCI